MEPSQSQMTDNPTKPKVMSFFPLQKLKGAQPVKTSAVLVAHLEEDSTDKEEGTQSDDPNGIESMTEGFIVYVARAVRTLNRMRNAVTTAAAHNILSANVHWWRHPEQPPI